MGSLELMIRGTLARPQNVLLLGRRKGHLIRAPLEC